MFGEKMIEEQLKNIEERLEAAAPGPWSCYTSVMDSPSMVVYSENGTVCGSTCGVTYSEKVFLDIANAKFIAHSPSDIRNLIDAVKIMVKELKNHHETWAQINNDNLCLAECRRTCKALAEASKCLARGSR